MIQIVNDIGPDGEIIVTTSYFTRAPPIQRKDTIWICGIASDLPGEAQLQAAEKSVEWKTVSLGQYVTCSKTVRDG